MRHHKLLSIGLFLLLFLTYLLPSQAQEGEEKLLHHRLTVIMGNAHLPAGVSEDGGKKWLLLTTWGLDYDYRINEKWSLSLQSDIVIANFKVEAYKTNDKEFFERSYPVAIAVAGIYSFGEHLSAIAGGGVDIAEEGTIPLVRAGIDYGWEINRYWGVGVNMMWDIKIDAYDSWTFGVGASRRF